MDMFKNNWIRKNPKEQTFPQPVFRLGEIIEQQDNYLCRIYFKLAQNELDLLNNAIEIFLVVRGRTEQQCADNAIVLMMNCLEGELKYD